MRKKIGKKPWFYPLPVLIIGTYDENGTPDAMKPLRPMTMSLASSRFSA